jgi:ecdysteroid 25-hydroxylase CYP306A1
LICAEGESWREHRRFVMNVMKQLGMAGRQGASVMESRVMAGVVEFVHVKNNFIFKNKFQFTPQFCETVQGLECQVSTGVGGVGGVDLVPGLRHCIGNIINGVVFGRTYAADDPTWIWLQHLLDQGVKQVAVAGPINFLPVLRFPSKLHIFPFSLSSGSFEFWFCSGGRAKVLAQLSEDHVVHP